MDTRVKVKVMFTIDVPTSDPKKIFEAQDLAEKITRQVFAESFGRAHLLKIEAFELLSLDKPYVKI